MNAPPTPIVVVAGPPASGKSTVARAIADGLDLPLIAKDDIKEILFDSLGSHNRDWSRRLGTATYPLMYHSLERELRAGRSCLIEGTFDTEIATREFLSLHDRWPLDALQVFCSAPGPVLLGRYADRAALRHPGHVEAASVADGGRQLEDSRWLPLDLPGTLLRLDTTAFEDVDLDAVVLAAAAHLRSAASDEFG